VIKIFPDKALLKECDSVVDFGEELQETMDRMSQLMYAALGIGLAANQIGINQQIIAMDSGAGQVFLINPVKLSVSKTSFETEEGCLSFPGLRVSVSRPTEIEVGYKTFNGEDCRTTFYGLEGRIVQHEMDHLVGKTMLDHLTKSERNRVVRTWAASRHPQA